MPADCRQGIDSLTVHSAENIDCDNNRLQLISDALTAPEIHSFFTWLAAGYQPFVFIAAVTAKKCRKILSQHNLLFVLEEKFNCHVVHRHFIFAFCPLISAGITHGRQIFVLDLLF